jgi:DNA-binding IclR family transcriptional regulator
MLELMHRVSMRVLRSELYASSSADLLLCLVVWVGQAENKPMTSAKAAQFAGMPRPTAIRRLHELERKKIVTKRPDGKWLLNTDSLGVQPRIRDILANVQSIHRASAELSKLDNAAIARRKSQP